METILWFSALVLCISIPFLIPAIKADFERLKQLRKESDIEIGLSIDDDYWRFTMVDYLIMKMKALLGEKLQ